MNAEEKLKLVSEYRFIYWRGDGRNRHFLVSRGRDDLANCWDNRLRGADAYCWEENEALLIADLLARQENDHIVEVMERRFPGQFKGGPHDMAAKQGERKPSE